MDDLADLMGITVDRARMMVIGLWVWAAEHDPDGVITSAPPSRLARVVGWEDPEGNVVCVGNRIADNQRREVGGKELRVRVRLPRAYVVALKLEVEGDAAGLRVESEVNP